MSSLVAARAMTGGTVARSGCGSVGRRAGAGVAGAAAAVCAVLVAGCGAAVAGTNGAAGARSAASGTWGNAQKVPGLVVLNQGGDASIDSVSCASPGDCGAGGTYTDGSGHTQAFVVSQENGTWHNAEEAPGFSALNVGGGATFASVSCASAGSCSAGGAYTDGSGHTQAFVAGEKNGIWGKAARVLGTAALNKGIRSLSCASAGNCTAVGGGGASAVSGSPFVVTEKNGAWGTARKVPGLAALNVGGIAGLDSVSCSSAGNCSAGGYYKGGSGIVQAFIVSKKNGAWQDAEEVPGTAALNEYGAETQVLSCTSAGDCGAAGFYGAGCGCSEFGDSLPFVVTEKNGTWGTAQEVPGSSLNNAGYAVPTSLSCASAGNCSVGGNYDDGSQNGCCLQAFAVIEVNGTWGTAQEVPGTAALNVNGDASTRSVSCASAGNCSATGDYAGPGGAFVVSERSGIWQKAKEVPRIAALSQGGGARADSVSCASAGNCSAGGAYIDGAGHTQGFVVSQTATAVPGAGP